jgi:hypothetical protein
MLVALHEPTACYLGPSDQSAGVIRFSCRFVMGHTDDKVGTGDELSR